MYDLIVVGGGPAGASAAIVGAAAGFNVLLLERGGFPRQRVCGEFVSAESLDLLGNLLDSAHRSLLTSAIRINQTRVFVDGHLINADIHPAAASIARIDLDAALWASAESCGVDGRQNCRVENISGDGPFQVKTSVGNFESRAVINASGRWSNLTAGAKKTTNGDAKWIGLKAHFQGPATRGSVDLYFFEGGYCGVQPVNLDNSIVDENRINVCAMVRADRATTLQEVFGQCPQLERESRNWTQRSAPVSVAPLIFRDPRPERDKIFMAGDAAVFVDPFIGDGISLALRSGSLATQSLLPFLRNEISLVAAIAAYREAYVEKLAPVFNASSVIRRMLKLPRAVRTPLVHMARKSSRISQYVIQRTR